MKNKYKIPIITSVPFQIVYDYYKGELAYRKKRYVDAEKLLKKFLTDYDKSDEFIKKEIYKLLPKIHLFLGEIARIKGENKISITYYMKFLKEKPYNKQILLKLYDLLTPLDDKSKIIILNDIYIRNVDRLKFLINILYAKPFDKTILFYQKVLQEKYNIKMEKNMGKDLLIAKNYQNACANFTAALIDDYKFMIAIIIKRFPNVDIKSINLFISNKYYKIMNKYLLLHREKDYRKVNIIDDEINSIMVNYNIWNKSKNNHDIKL